MTRHANWYNFLAYTLKTILIHLQLTPVYGQVLHCTDGWSQIGDGCYALLHSLDFFGFRTVYQARRVCNEHGGDLASLETRRIHMQLFAMVQLLPVDVRPTRVYIGLTDIAEEGKYRWLDGENVTFSLWGPNEPNNLFNSNEDCVLLESPDRRWQDGGDTVWKDYPCCSGDLVSAVFCERAINSSGKPIMMDDLTNPLAEACFKDRNECQSNPCRQGGVCEDRFLDFHCLCPVGLTGRHCESDLHCPRVPMWADYNISTKDTLYRTLLNYTCADKDYKFPDEAPYKTAECNASGLWEPAFAECAVPEKDHKPIAKRYTRPTEAVGAPAVGSVAIIFLILELSFLVFLDMDYFIRELTPLCAKLKLTKKANDEEEVEEQKRTLCCPCSAARYVMTSESEAQPSMSTCAENQLENGQVDTRF